MAKHNLALMLREGKGARAMAKEAIELLRSAARQGMSASMFTLGDIYERGDVTPKDQGDGARLVRDHRRVREPDQSRRREPVKETATTNGPKPEAHPASQRAGTGTTSSARPNSRDRRGTAASQTVGRAAGPAPARNGSTGGVDAVPILRAGQNPLPTGSAPSSRRYSI